MMAPLFQLRTTWRLGSNAIASNAWSRPSPISTRTGIGTELDAGADLAKLGRLLVDRDLEPASSQRDGGRQPAEPGADHRDAAHFTHSPPVQSTVLPGVQLEQAIVDLC